MEYLLVDAHSVALLLSSFLFFFFSFSTVFLMEIDCTSPYSTSPVSFDVCCSLVWPVGGLIAVVGVSRFSHSIKNLYARECVCVCVSLMSECRACFILKYIYMFGNVSADVYARYFYYYCYYYYKYYLFLPFC